MNTRLKRSCTYNEGTFTSATLRNLAPGGSPVLSVFLPFLLGYSTCLITLARNRGQLRSSLTSRRTLVAPLAPSTKYEIWLAHTSARLTLNWKSYPKINSTSACQAYSSPLTQASPRCAYACYYYNKTLRLRPVA
jgi:hypothetical protein